MPAESKAQRIAMAIALHQPDKLHAKNRGLLQMPKMQLLDFASSESPAQSGSQTNDPADESAFRTWYAQMSREHDLDPDPDAPGQFYDYRAAYRAGAKPDDTGHWPSAFKLEGHPNLVVGGFHVKTGERVPGTKRAGYQELISLGWEPVAAIQLASQPEPSIDTKGKPDHVKGGR